MSKIQAPFNDAQVEALNAWQRWGSMRPFTCPTHPDAPLRAETAGWRCAEDGCRYTQDWAHDFMVKTKYCTKDHPCPADAPASEYWIHVEAVDVNPEWEGDVVPYHCPTCGRDFEVDFG